jgi:phosphoserine phosphatase
LRIEGLGRFFRKLSGKDRQNEANKGAVVEYLSSHMQAPTQAITIGDQPNDVPIFR